MPNQDYEFPCHGFSYFLYYFLIKGGGIEIFGVWRKATAGHAVTYHTDSLYYSALQCRAFGCLGDAGCVLLAVYELPELPR